jgi:ribosomal protein S12 methylthiotransferase
MSGALRRRELPVLGTRAASPSARAVPAVPGAPRIGIVTLGCDKNTVDTERLLAGLASAGANVVRGAEDADVVVINTCGFIDVAKEESVDTILDAARLKAEGRVRAVVAMGCLVQRYKPELTAEMPEVDLFLGLTEAERLVPELRARGLLPPAESIPTMERPLRLLSTRSPHTSYLKVSEGCDHTCAFCAIPLMRGKHRSTPIEVLVREARELEAQGVVELNLVSQDTTWYGRDLVRGLAPGDGAYFVGKPFPGMAGITDGQGQGQVYGRGKGNGNGDGGASASARTGLLPDLLAALLDGTTIPWLRLFYMYPSGISRQLVETIAREPRIVPYLDMPIQHGADAVLARMRRPERRSTIEERVRWLRASIPDIALRTTVIVGFPGETDDEFEELIALLEEIRFDRVGAFAYSREENTRAADFPDPVPADVARERLERLGDLQRSIAQARNDTLVGTDASALVDRVVGRSFDGDDDDDAGSAAAVRDHPRGAVCRTARQALGVDGVVHVADARGAVPGDFIRVRITEAFEDDVSGERIA